MSRTKLARLLSTSFERVMLILSQTALIGLVIVALAFDFLNGLHDTANSIATLVSTRMLRPRYAVIWAAFFNFIAFLVFGVHVAQTIGVGIISPEVMDAQVIFGALVGAIIWNVITWWAGIPSSSSHALIGGLVGAGATKAGVGAIVWSGLLTTGAFIVLSPLLGFFLALLLVLAVSWVFVRANPRAAEPVFQWLQFGAASLISLGHGGNDAQKTMGIIAVLLFLAGITWQRVLRSVLGRDYLSGSDCSRHFNWRMAHRKNRRVENNKNDPCAGLLRVCRRRHHVVCRDLSRNSGLYHPYSNRRRDWSGRSAEGIGGPVEYCDQHSRRLDHNTSGVSPHGGAVLRCSSIPGKLNSAKQPDQRITW